MQNAARYFEQNPAMTPREKYRLASRWLRDYYERGPDPAKPDIEVDLFGKYGTAAMSKMLAGRDPLTQNIKVRRGVGIPF